MYVNRVAHLLNRNQLQPSESTTGFTFNPLLPATPSWQAQFYQAAYLQAQKEIEAARDEWPLAEWWD